MKTDFSLEAVILDLGGVVFAISVDQIIKSWAKSAGCHPKDIAPKFKVDEYYKLFEMGKISPEEYRSHVYNVLGIRISDEDFDEGWNSIYLELLPGIESLLLQLKDKTKLIVLTNTNEIHAREWRIRYADILRHFDRVFASHEIGARKPSPESFNAILDYLGTTPDKVVFFDDTPDNVEGALSIGISSFVVNSPYEVSEKLKQMGIEIEI
ncbi:MAG: glucose-phosphatase [Candidatus Poribacteria bacterium]|nr:glucose-phosphatase [Candidatus Poribacteria bacterium]